jgi:hypothetical protein
LQDALSTTQKKTLEIAGENSEVVSNRDPITLPASSNVDVMTQGQNFTNEYVIDVTQTQSASGVQEIAFTSKITTTPMLVIK